MHWGGQNIDDQVLKQLLTCFENKFMVFCHEKNGCQNTIDPDLSCTVATMMTSRDSACIFCANSLQDPPRTTFD